MITEFGRDSSVSVGHRSSYLLQLLPSRRDLAVSSLQLNLLVRDSKKPLNTFRLCLIFSRDHDPLDSQESKSAMRALASC